MHDELAAVAVNHQELADRRIEIPRVVRQLLVIELQFAGIGVERDDRRGIEVGAGPRSALLPVCAGPVVKWRRIRRSPPDGIRFRIVAAGHPAATTAGAPGFIAPGRLGLLGAGDGEEFPFLRAGFDIDAEDRAA